MISAFEATILGFVLNRPSSRYEIMKAFQDTSFYWSGSPGAVYAAIARLQKRGLLQEGTSSRTKTYEVTTAGRYSLQEFLKVPIPAAKLLLDPVLLRIKLRGLDHLSVAERIHFYQAQIEEIDQAKHIINTKRHLNPQSKISQQLADLALDQINLERELIDGLLSEALMNQS